MKFNHILIITYGRSGSTLLMSLLNTVDGVLIAGENFNLCLHLFRAYKALLNSKKHGNTSNLNTDPFFMAHKYNSERFLQDAYILIKNQIVGSNPNIKYWGFKEIRYTKVNFLPDESLVDYLDFLRQLFPNCAFIFLTRNHVDVIRSGFWKKMNPEKVREILIDFEDKINFYHEKNKNFTYIIDYNDIKTLSNKLKYLFEDFLGFSYNEKVIKEKLLIPHSYDINEKNIKKIGIEISNFNIPKDLLVASIDMFPKQILLYQNFSISGVLLFNNGETYDLRVSGCRSQFQVLYNLPSPKYGKNYKNIPNSNTAGFRIENLMFESLDQYIDISVIYDKGEYILWRLKLSFMEDIKNEN